MKKLCSVFSVLLLTLTIASMAPSAPAQSDHPSVVGTSSHQSEEVARGELLKVDTTNQTFTIKTAGDMEMEFHYTSETKVEGSKTGVQGLSSETGTRVAVYYREDSGQRMATRIEINKKSEK